MLKVDSLLKSFGDHTVIDHVSFEVEAGDFFTMLGPSGCGKTTILQCIAGLQTPTAGSIEMAGKVVYSSAQKLFVPASHRNLGMVFQSYAIWPHMTVFENVAFPLVHGARQRVQDVDKRVMHALEMVKLQDYAQRPAPFLSGGQQQRVALARALVHQPELLLLDEPLSNLDAKLRDVMRIEIRNLVKSMGITTIFVTHDQLEALSMSDTVMLLRGGHIVQKGSPQEVFLRPNTEFTADFMGRSNLIPGKLSASGSHVTTSFGEVACNVASGLTPGADVALVVRPNVVRTVAAGNAARGQNTFVGRIESQTFLGDLIEADVVLGGQVMRVALDPYAPLANGQEVEVQLPAECCIAVPAESAGRRG